MKRSANILAYLLQTVIFLVLAGCGGQNDSSSSVVTFSDVHFDPFYDPAIFNDLVSSPVEKWAEIFKGSSVTEPASWGNDSNYPLFGQALTALQPEASHASVAIFPGDILAHDFGDKFFRLYGKEDDAALRAFVFKTVKFFTLQVREHLGNVPVVFTNGNNDGYGEDYKIVPGSQYFSDTAEVFYNDFLLGAADHASYLETYKAGGYFSMEIPGSNVTVVSLNTVFFSPKAATGIDSAISTELDWLEKTLSSARERGAKVWIVMHIPPGTDIYSTVSKYMDGNGRVSDAVTLWKQDIQKRYLEIIGNNADILEIGYAGHTHMDEFRLSLKTADAPRGSLVIIPSISPRSTNNPAFKVITNLSADWTPRDYREVLYRLGSTNAVFKNYYTFSSVYDLRNSLDESLSQLYPLLNTDVAKRQAYIDAYYSGHDSSRAITDTKWRAYWCGAGNMAKEEFKECVNSN